MSQLADDLSSGVPNIVCSGQGNGFTTAVADLAPMDIFYL